MECLCGATLSSRGAPRAELPRPRRVTYGPRVPAQSAIPAARRPVRAPNRRPARESLRRGPRCDVGIVVDEHRHPVQRPQHRKLGDAGGSAISAAPHHQAARWQLIAAQPFQRRLPVPLRTPGEVDQLVVVGQGARHSRALCRWRSSAIPAKNASQSLGRRCRSCSRWRTSATVPSRSMTVMGSVSGTGTLIRGEDRPAEAEHAAVTAQVLVAACRRRRRASARPDSSRPARQSDSGKSTRQQSTPRRPVSEKARVSGDLRQAGQVRRVAEDAVQLLGWTAPPEPVSNSTLPSARTIPTDRFERG